MATSPDGRQYKCRPCVDAYKVEWNARNIDRCREVRRAADIRRYGITMAQYDALVAAQGGACAICRQVFTAVKDTHVDHDHRCCPPAGSQRAKRCGTCVRGILCGQCNKGLGMFRDDVETLNAAIRYLRRE